MTIFIKNNHEKIIHSSPRKAISGDRRKTIVEKIKDVIHPGIRKMGRRSTSILLKSVPSPKQKLNLVGCKKWGSMYL